MLDQLKALQEQKGRIVAEQRSVIDKAEGRGFSAEERTAFDKHDSDIADIDRKIKAAEREEADKRSIADATNKVDEEKRSVQNKDAEAEARGQAFEAYMRHGFANLTDGEKRSLGGFQKADGAVNERAQSSSGAAGGYTIPRGFSGEMDKALKEYGGMLELGRTWTTGDGAVVDWPTFDDTSNTGYILGENTSAETGSQDVAFGQKQLGAYLYTSGVIKVPNTLLQDSAFDLPSLITEALATRFGRIQSTHLTIGTGTNQPQGVVVGAGEVTQNVAASVLTSDNIIDLIHSVDPAYRKSPGVGLTFNDMTLAAIRKLKDSDGKYIWSMGNIQTGVAATVFGYGYTINQDLDTIATGKKSVGFGDFKRYIIRRVQDILIRRLEERYAENNQVGFVGFMRMDGKLLNPGAVKFLKHA